MVDDGNTARQQADAGGHGNARPNSSTPPSSPSQPPRRPRRAGATTPSKLSQAASSSTNLPPPPTPTPTPPTPSADGILLGTARRPVICPICKKDMYHEKALCGHIRWHTQEERLAASRDIARALSANVVSGQRGDGEQGPSKRFKLPDLNEPPPSED
ncbi:hypothetical protein Lser_V15G39727 [Lactuca serriola]